MSGVTRRDVNKASDEEERAESADTMSGHLDEGPRQHHPAVPSGRRSFRKVAEPGPRGHMEHHPAAAPAADVLPGSRTHVDHEGQFVDLTQKLDVGPAKPYYSGMMAHGVPLPVVEHGGRPTAMAGDRAALQATAPAKAHPVPKNEHPVPVYIVDVGSGGKALGRMATKQVTAPVAGSQPVQIAGKDLARSKVRLLNEDGTNGVRIGIGPTSETGVLLPALMTSYEEFVTQDDIWCVSDAADVVLLSVIIEYSVPNGA